MWKSLVALLSVVLLPWLASTLADRLGVRGDFAEALFGPAPDEAVWDAAAPPPGWRENAYLTAYPDVAAAVLRGTFASGYEHYRKFGEAEGRTAGLAPGATVHRAQDTPPAAVPPSAPPVPSPPPSQPPAAAAPEPPPSAAPPPTAPAEPADDRPAAGGGDRPAAGGDGRYVVRSGGSLDRVAEITGRSAAALRAANPELPDTWLPAGTVVRLPAADGARPAPPAAAPAAVPAPPAASPAPSAPSAPSPAAAPAPAAPPRKPAADAAPRLTVTGVRYGAHPDATRIVLDLSGPMPPPPARRRDDRTLVFDLADVGWTAAPKGTLRGTPGLRFRTEPLPPAGTRLILDADAPIRLKYSAPFAPSGERGHRMVIDVAPAG
ncbi:LysM peptidoglycan-binding domain-containing protein [Azospirillum sp. ST 5-10]|uniref:LysM peptidoglycan-binding domain-containing protein n=1 Tax=unclassified Azospirillum TaxID=2630922 RepID=UPI003F49DC6D